jgi:hypothetical protein
MMVYSWPCSKKIYTNHALNKAMKCGVIVLSLVLAISFITLQPEVTVSAASVYYVGGFGVGNYSSIQEAIDDAESGDHIHIYQGTYLENILIDKELALFGDEETIIDGKHLSDTVYIRADNVALVGVRVVNSGGSGAGIVIEGNNVMVRRCVVTDNFYGIYTSFDHGLFTRNTIYNNVYNAWDTGSNEWNDGQLGNHWGDYIGTDGDGDGIGNDPYVIPGNGNADQFPLVYPYGPPIAQYDIEVAGKEVQSDGSASFDYDGTIINWTWNWGDGNTSVTKVAKHTYERDGLYPVSLTVVDNNNSEDTFTQQWHIDTVAPKTSLTPTPPQPNGLQGWYASAVWVTLTSIDTGSGTASIKYRFSNQIWQTYQGAIKISADGHHTLEYYAVDTAGNKETKKSWSVDIDRNAPITSSEPELNESTWYAMNVAVELEGHDVTAGISHSYFRVNGGAFYPYIGRFNITRQGINHLEYFSMDTAGNREVLQRVNVRIDTANPTVDIASPQEHYFYLMGRPILPLDRFSIIIGSVNVEVMATDASSGISRVEFYTDGTHHFTDREAPYVWEWTASALGPYTIEVTAYDYAGNTARTEFEAVMFNL